jgi:hypothetical protein
MIDAASASGRRSGEGGSSRGALRLGLVPAMMLAVAAGCGNEAAALLATPAWGQPAALQLRADTKQGDLLLRQVGGPVYRLAQGVRLESVAALQWDSAASPVVDCEQQPLVPDLHLVAGQAVLRGRPLTLGGARADSAVLAPGGRVAALLSSSGQRGSVAPALGVGRTLPYFLDLIDAHSGATLAPSLKLPFAGRTSAARVCFSADAAFLIVHDLLQTGLVAVPIRLRE